ncbi:Pathogenesis-related protein PR-4 (Fragment) [Linum perenne]
MVVASLVTQSSCTIENSNHWCGPFPDGTCAGNCEQGRCCSITGYCNELGWCCTGQGDSGYGNSNCYSPCTSTTSSNTTAALRMSSGALINATRSSYLDVHSHVTDGGERDRDRDRDRGLNTTSSLSCAAAASSRDQKKQYPLAAFLAVQGQANVTYSSNCGRCLKVTNVGVVGGVRREVTVRIVHERISSNSTSVGIELDSNGFKQLDIDVSRKLNGQLMVKYEFVSC